MFTFLIWQTSSTSHIDHRVTPTHHLQDCEYILSVIVHSVCDLGLTICVGPESAWRRVSGSDGWIGSALDDIVLSIPCVSQMGSMFLRVHYTAHHGRQDTNHQKTHQTIQVRANTSRFIPRSERLTRYFAGVINPTAIKASRRHGGNPRVLTIGCGADSRASSLCPRCVNLPLPLLRTYTPRRSVMAAIRRRAIYFPTALRSFWCIMSGSLSYSSCTTKATLPRSHTTLAVETGWSFWKGVVPRQYFSYRN
jgi:hypothetical protein